MVTNDTEGRVKLGSQQPCINLVFKCGRESTVSNLLVIKFLTVGKGQLVEGGVWKSFMGARAHVTGMTLGLKLRVLQLTRL